MAFNQQKNWQQFNCCGGEDLQQPHLNLGEGIFRLVEAVQVFGFLLGSRYGRRPNPKPLTLVASAANEEISLFVADDDS